MANFGSRGGLRYVVPVRATEASSCTETGKVVPMPAIETDGIEPFIDLRTKPCLESRADLLDTGQQKI